MLLMGVIDYARIMYVRQLMDNAAREGARYAAVHTHDKTTSEIESYVRALMVRQDQILGATVAVYKASQSDGSNQGVWTSAGFGESIAVQINVTLRPFVPRLLMMQTTVPLQAKVLMYSEAN
jgi:Flp pilus assembly protein TadG